MIVTYNQVDLIGETIESVVSQGYENLEVVVSDDASTDGTQAVIADYERRYPGIIKPVFNPINLGVTGNSNTAFEACTGELIAVLGGDDLFLPGKLLAQVGVFEDHEVVMSYHSVDVFVHQTGEVLFTTNTTANERLADVYDVVAKCGVPGASSLMVRRSACPDYGFDTNFPVVSDWLFCIEVALKGKIKEVSGVYGKYRKHGMGASERTFELLDESLRTLDVIAARFPEDNRMQKACRRGANRYLYGELYRQIIKKNPEKIRALRPYLLERCSGGQRFMTSVTLSLLGNRALLGMLIGPLQELKSTLKRRA